MATASNDPKNLVRPVLKLSDPKLVLAPGRFPPISNPNLPGPSSASQPSANDQSQSNPPFNNQSSGRAHLSGMPKAGGGGNGWDNGTSFFNCIYFYFNLPTSRRYSYHEQMVLIKYAVLTTNFMHQFYHYYTGVINLTCIIVGIVQGIYTGVIKWIFLSNKV